MQEGSNSSRADRIRKPLLVPGNSSSDPLFGDSSTASSVDTRIQIDADAEHLHSDGADSLTTPPRPPFAPAAAPNGLASGSLDPAHSAGGKQFLPRPEGFAETAGSGGDVVMDVDVLTTQEPVTDAGTANGTAGDGERRSPSVSPQPTRESGPGDVPTDLNEVPFSRAVDAYHHPLLRDTAFLDLTSPMTAYEWFKVIFLFPWAALKLLVILLCLVIVWGWVRVLMIGVPINTPLPKWRFHLVRPWLKFWTGLFLRAGLSLWPRFVGWHNYRQAKKERAIIVFNHQSYTDAIVMTSYFAPSGVAKASVASLPFIGTITVALQFLFVQRRGSADKNNRHTQEGGHTVEKLTQRAADSRYPLLMIAPEGTTKHGNVLLRFSTGAFVPGRPVLPVLLKYRHKHFDVGWGITNTPWHIYRLLTQFANCLEVEALPVYHPSPEEQDNPALFTANIRKLMGERLGATLVDQGIGHNVALRKAGVGVNLMGTRIVKKKPTTLR